MSTHPIATPSRCHAGGGRQQGVPRAAATVAVTAAAAADTATTAAATAMGAASPTRRHVISMVRGRAPNNNSGVWGDGSGRIRTGNGRAASPPPPPHASGASRGHPTARAGERRRLGGGAAAPWGGRRRSRGGAPSAAPARGRVVSGTHATPRAGHSRPPLPPPPTRNGRVRRRHQRDMSRRERLDGEAPAGVGNDRGDLPPRCTAAPAPPRGYQRRRGVRRRRAGRTPPRRRGGPVRQTRRACPKRHPRVLPTRLARRRPHLRAPAPRRLSPTARLSARSSRPPAQPPARP